MHILSKQLLYLFTATLVPLLTFLNPKFFMIFGLPPSWAILWLLPWAIEKGQFLAIFAGLSLGLTLDGISLEGASQIPALICLGYWWGGLGNRGPKIESIFNLALLAWIGSLLLGMTLWLQMLSFEEFLDESFVSFWAFKNVLAQAIITSIFAPVICSWLLLVWRKI